MGPINVTKIYLPPLHRISYMRNFGHKVEVKSICDIIKENL
jgi:hypothetical protein